MTEMSWLLFAGLTFGGVMGWGARDMHFLASKETTAQKHKEALKEKDDEIKRLRTIIAGIIGREDRLTAAEVSAARREITCEVHGAVRCASCTRATRP